MTGVLLTGAPFDALLRHAADGYPLEVCGLLLGPSVADERATDNAMGGQLMGDEWAADKPMGNGRTVDEAMGSESLGGERTADEAMGDELRVTHAVPCPNMAAPAERRHRFSIDPRAVLNVRRALRGTSRSIIGFYHSHPDAEAQPSATDLEFFRLWPETVWLIIPVWSAAPQSPRAWWLDHGLATAPRELPVRAVSHVPVVAGCPDEWAKPRELS